MARYEKAEHVAREEAAWKIIGAAYPWEKIKMADRFHADWFVYHREDPEQERPSPVCLIEHKYRKVQYRGEGHHLMIGLEKILGCLRYAEAMQVPFYLAITFNKLEDLRWMRFQRVNPLWVRWGGRMHRMRRSGDVEPCVYIPQQLFIPITTLPLTQEEA